MKEFLALHGNQTEIRSERHSPEFSMIHPELILLIDCNDRRRGFLSSAVFAWIQRDGPLSA